MANEHLKRRSLREGYNSVDEKRRKNTATGSSISMICTIWIEVIVDTYDGDNIFQQRERAAWKSCLFSNDDC